MAEEAAEEAKEESAEEAPAEENKAEATETPEAKTAQEKPKADEDLPLSVEEMFGIRLSLPSLNGSAIRKNTACQAMINMLIADKVIDQSEMCYLEDALGLVNSDEERAALMETAKKREVTPMENLNTDRMYAGHFFYYLAMIVAAGESQNFGSQLSDEDLRQVGISTPFCQGRPSLGYRSCQTE